jgi:hypothetical protein
MRLHDTRQEMKKRIYGEQPFWFWNGTMDANEVRRRYLP